MKRGTKVLLAAATAGLIGPGLCLGVVSSNGGANPPYTGININDFLGADRFYTNSYTGSRAIVSNIEAGHIWSGHVELGHVTTRIDAGMVPPNGDFDWHATEVGGCIGGRPGGANPGEWQRGIAYGAELWSGAIATSWSGTPPTRLMGFVPQSFQPIYYQTMVSGVSGRTTDVVNSSWG